MIRHFSATFFCLIAVAAVARPTHMLFADILLPGRKRVSHELVFVDSQLLQAHRLIAVPVRGFGGVEEIQPERPFHFSSKYRTRLYVVPSDFVVPDRVGPGESLPFPSCAVPVPSITSVPKFSPVASILSTCKLVEVSENEIQVELVDHVELDTEGRPANMLRSTMSCALHLSAEDVLGKAAPDSDVVQSRKANCMGERAASDRVTEAADD